MCLKCFGETAGGEDQRHRSEYVDLDTALGNARSELQESIVTIEGLSQSIQSQKAALTEMVTSTNDFAAAAQHEVRL